MFKHKSIRRYVRQITAIIEKEFFIQLRFKSKIISRYLNPIIQLLILVFIFGIIFTIKTGLKLGYWNAQNYLLFILIAFCIQFSRSVLKRFENMFMTEKYWKTLSAIMIAPVNRFVLLIGTLVSEFILFCIPLIILLTIAYILYPISFLTLILVLIVFLSMYLILASLGLIIGVYGISNEKYVPYLNIGTGMLLLFSCINYPKEIFPEIIQMIIVINPFYYVFDIIRLTWYLGINYELAIVQITYIHIFIIISFTIVFPIFAILLFNRIYKKHGIVGY